MLYLYITTLKRKGGEFGESTNHFRKRVDWFPEWGVGLYEK